MLGSAGGWPANHQHTFGQKHAIARFVQSHPGAERETTALLKPIALMNEPDRTPIHPTTACRRCIIGGEREGRSAPPPQQQPDTITFASLSSLAAVLSDENRRLLRTLHQREPQSLTELAGLTGRKVPSLSRTLKVMERYGLVELKRRGVAVIPSALAIRFSVVLD